MHLKSINPSTGQEIETYKEFSNDEIQKILEDIHLTQMNWKQTSLEFRLDCLRNLTKYWYVLMDVCLTGLITLLNCKGFFWSWIAILKKTNTCGPDNELKHLMQCRKRDIWISSLLVSLAIWHKRHKFSDDSVTPPTTCRHSCIHAFMLT